MFLSRQIHKMKASNQLHEYIHVEHSIIPKDICDSTISKLDHNKWQPHGWSDSSAKNYNSNDTRELGVQQSTREDNQILLPYMAKAVENYQPNLITRFSLIRFNRYIQGQIMREHFDHIYSLFDGREKGIPVLSLILNLNDNYEGADLLFWDDYRISLGLGDIVIFPSIFLFPHKVSETIKGQRYSAVSWAW